MTATQELLRRRGYAASGLGEIVARSGAPKGSLYFHFPGGKQELAIAAMERSAAQLRDAMAAILDSSEDLDDGIGRLIDALAAGSSSRGSPTAARSPPSRSRRPPTRADAGGGAGGVRLLAGGPQRAPARDGP